MAIGPTLPPRLQKLADEQQEQEEDKDDSYGPAPPCPAQPTPAPSFSIGPTLPPHLQAKVDAGKDDDSDDDDSLGPALPPHLLAARQDKAAASTPPSSASRPPVGPQRPTAGPSRPPAGYQAPSPPRRGRYDDDSSDDDVVGPMPVPEGMEAAYSGSAVRDFQEREARWAKEREVRPLVLILYRESWHRWTDWGEGTAGRATLELAMNQVHLDLSSPASCFATFRKPPSPRFSLEKNGC